MTPPPPPTPLPARRAARELRDRVTADDLNVAPALLGLPLARPSRRLAAMAIDVAALALVSDLGNLWLVAGVALLGVVHLGTGETPLPPRYRWPAWLLAAVLLAFGAQQAWVAYGTPHPHHRATSDDDDDDTIEAAAAAKARATPEHAAQARIAALEVELAQARRPKAFDPRERVLEWADDVGLGLGWTIAYFTLFPAWWKGQTPGKRLLGLRVRELTGKPITVMRAFKRYGGYAAGLSTGGLGFAQALWDPNRQAIQDKTAHTVVIDLRRKLAPTLPVPASITTPDATPPEELR